MTGGDIISLFKGLVDCVYPTRAVNRKACDKFIISNFDAQNALCQKDQCFLTEYSVGQIKNECKHVIITYSDETL